MDYYGRKRSLLHLTSPPEGAYPGLEIGDTGEAVQAGSKAGVNRAWTG